MTIKGIATVPFNEPQPFQCKYEKMIHRPGDPITARYIPFKELGVKVRGFLSALISDDRDRMARAFWCAGPSGAGKTKSLIISCLEAGYAVAVIPAGTFSGQHEGNSVRALNDVLDELEKWARHNKLPVVLMINDLDLSVASVGKDVTVTINSQMFVNHCMELCDTPHIYVNPNGGPIPFVYTVNDATNMRESLTRSGRAEWCEFIPTTEDKTNVAWRVFDPQTTPARELLAALVRKYAASQSVAFWEDLAKRIKERTGQAILEKGMPTQAQSNQIYGGRPPLDDPNLVWTAARELRQRRIKNYLAKRFTLPWGRR